MPEPGAAPGLLDVARRWAATFADTKGVTLPPEELEQLLLGVAPDAVDHAGPGHDGALLRFTALYAASPMGIALADPGGEIVEANLALGQLLGCSPDELRGRHLTDLGSTDHDVSRLKAGLEQVRGGRERYQERMLLDHTEDGQLWTDVTLARLPGDRPGSVYPVLMVSDANELHLLQERLLHQNVHDPLTGLPNASSFTTKLEAALGAGARDDIALIYLDVDGFKVVNDGLGAGVGDQVLRGVAGKLSAVFTGHHDGFVARLSGDGFAVLLRGELSATAVVELVERALEDLNEPIYLGGHGIGVSASAGIVVRAAVEGGAAELLRAAEIALHRAKEAGKAQWMLFDPELDARDRGRYQLGAVIAGALENGEFSLVYQPTVTPDRHRAHRRGQRGPALEPPGEGRAGLGRVLPAGPDDGDDGAAGALAAGGVPGGDGPLAHPLRRRGAGRVRPAARAAGHRPGPGAAGEGAAGQARAPGERAAAVHRPRLDARPARRGAGLVRGAGRPGHAAGADDLRLGGPGADPRGTGCRSVT